VAWSASIVGADSDVAHERARLAEADRHRLVWRAASAALERAHLSPTPTWPRSGLPPPPTTPSRLEMSKSELW
jgi:hypothetical protein